MSLALAKVDVRVVVFECPELILELALEAASLSVVEHVGHGEAGGWRRGERDARGGREGADDVPDAIAAPRLG